MDKDFQNTNASGVIKGETEKPKVITAKISVEVIDNDDRLGKMSAKRRAFIRRREKRIARNFQYYPLSPR